MVCTVVFVCIVAVTHGGNSLVGVSSSGRKLRVVSVAFMMYFGVHAFIGVFGVITIVRCSYVMLVIQVTDVVIALSIDIVVVVVIAVIIDIIHAVGFNFVDFSPVNAIIFGVGVFILFITVGVDASL